VWASEIPFAERIMTFYTDGANWRDGDSQFARSDWRALEVLILAHALDDVRRGAEAHANGLD
jgi:hypothetical protein